MAFAMEARLQKILPKPFVIMAYADSINRQYKMQNSLPFSITTTNHSMTNKKFAAFIVTYNRPDILMDTIQKMLDQTRPPDKLVIVDNNDNDDTKNKAAQMFPGVEHIKVGHNSGFAGGG